MCLCSFYSLLGSTNHFSSIIYAHISPVAFLCAFVHFTPFWVQQITFLHLYAHIINNGYHITASLSTIP